MPSPDPAVAGHLEYMRLRGLAPYTIYQRGRHLARLAAALGPVPLLDATPAMLAVWRAGLAVGEDGIRNYVGAAQQFYQWSTGQGLIAVSPAAGLPVPRPGRRLPRPIATDDLFIVLQAAPPRIRPWIVLAAWCGLRAKEIAFLRRDRVLDTARSPVILVACDATKGRRERAVPMCPFVVAELAPVLPSGGWAFRRLDGGRGPNAPWLVSKLAGEHMRGCGVIATLHNCRHWFGTEAFHVHRDLRQVQELMGHASPAATALYTWCDPRGAAETVAALPVPWPASAREEAG